MADARRVALLSVHTSPLDQAGAGDGGGLNVYVRQVAMRLAQRGVHVDVFTRRTSPDSPATVTMAPGVDVHNIDAGPLGAVDKDAVSSLLCGFVLAVERHRTAGTHDVLHAHYWLSGWVARRLSARWNVPFVHTFHTLGVLKNATLAPDDVPEPPLRLVAERRIAHDADRLLVLTCGEASLLHRTYGVSGARLTVVPPGVDLNRFSPGPERAPGARLLFVGRLQPLKGPDIAVRTLAEVRRHLPDAQLDIIGGASGTGSTAVRHDELQSLARELGVEGAVRMRDAVPQDALADHYRAADVVLVPSRSETFGLVALEAQACGIPVVAAKVPGLDTVVAGGGMLVDGHEPIDHARAVLDLLGNPDRYAAARTAALTTAAGSTWEITVDRLQSAYREVIVERHQLQALAG